MNQENLRFLESLSLEYNAVTNADKLSKLIDKYIIPQELEKKQNAEVTTPYDLRQEMLNTIPTDFWTTPKKVFEPCSGKGGFVLDIVSRFMDGLKDLILDENERYRVIVEECLYCCDINPTNVFICKLLLDPYNQYKLLFNEGNTLELDIKEKWEGLVGFDLVVGNPPYQDTINGISKGGGNNLFTKFMYTARENVIDNGFVLYINPPTFFSAGRSSNKDDMSVRNDMFMKHYIHMINLEECAKYFKEGSKFIYYLLQKRDDKNENINVICKYKKNIYNNQIINQNILQTLEYLPYLLTNESINIMSKIKNKECRKIPIFNSTVFDKRRYYVSKTRSEVFIYPIQATGTQVVYSSKPCKNQYNKKVIMSESGYLRPFYDNGVLGVGGHCFSCLVDNQEEGEYIINLLNSPLYTFYIEINKWSGFHHKKVLQDLPYIPHTIGETNMYEYFNLSENEIQFVLQNE